MIFGFAVFASMAVILLEQILVLLTERYALAVVNVFSSPLATNYFNINIKYFSDPLGIYSFLNSIITPFFSILSINQGLNIFLIESQNNTMEFLLTKPFSRRQIFLNKIIYAIYYILLSSLIFLLGSFISILIISGTGFSLKLFLLTYLPFPIINAVFMAIGMSLGSFLFMPGASLIISAGVVTLSYLAGAAGTITQNIPLRYLSPPHYFTSQYILENNSLEPVFLLVSASIIFIFIWLSYMLFKRKQV
jgi:ABC-2 type transport system permease protein